MMRLAPLRSYLWLAAPVLAYNGVLFPMNIAATASHHCVKALKDHGATLAAVSDVSWMRTDGTDNLVAVVFERDGGPVTGKCTFKADTHVVADIELKPSNAMAEFLSKTHATWFPLP